MNIDEWPYIGKWSSCYLLALGLSMFIGLEIGFILGYFPTHDELLYPLVATWIMVLGLGVAILPVDIVKHFIAPLMAYNKELQRTARNEQQTHGNSP